MKKAIIKKKEVKDIRLTDIKKYLCENYSFSPNTGFELYETDVHWVFLQGNYGSEK